MRPLRHLSAIAVLALVLATAAPAAATHGDADAAVQVEGRCVHDGDSGSGSAGVVISDIRVFFGTPGADVDVEPTTSEEALGTLGPCVEAAQDGDTPDGGSYGAATVANGPNHVQASTVPATDAATDAGVREPATDATAASVGASGQCNDGSSGGGGDLGASLGTGDGVTTDTDPDSSQDGIAACASAASGGQTPSGGSYLAADASAADGAAQAGASTVPASDLATGQSDSAQTAADASGACRDDDGDGAEDSAHASADVDGSTATSTPDPLNIRDAAVRCAANVVPGPGSYLRAGVSAADGLLVASVDTVPLTNLVGGSGVTVEGACYYDGSGAQDSGGVGTGGVDLGNPSNVISAVTACATAASDGSTPDGGSYIAVTVTVADDERRYSSVAVTDAVTELA